MKSYFRWKANDATQPSPNGDESVSVCAEDNLSPVHDTPPVACLESHKMRKGDGFVFAQSGQRVSADMIVQTIAVQNAEQEVLNAVLLCSFAVPGVGRNFVAYSLNESVGEMDMRVYIAMLYWEKGQYRLSAMAPENGWRTAFGQIINPQSSTADEDLLPTYHHIDIGQREILAAPFEQHISLSLNKAVVMRLLSRAAPTVIGLAIEGGPVPNESVPVAMQVIPEAPELSMTPSAADAPVALDDDQDILLNDVQKTLGGITRVVQGLAQQRLALGKQRERQEVLQSHLQEKEGRLSDREQRLEERAAHLQTCLATLEEREMDLQSRDAVLAHGLQQLSIARKKFNELFKVFSDSVQLDNIRL